MIDDEYLEPEPVTSGVPQGAVLGSILFLYFINYLPAGLSSCVRLFADDTIVYNNAWEKKWDMELNACKCEHMLFLRKRSPSIHPLSIHVTVITRTTEDKCLGVVVDDVLTFNSHVAAITGKASSRLGFLRRNVQTSSQTVKAMPYKQLIRPQLKHASAALD